MVGFQVGVLVLIASLLAFKLFVLLLAGVWTWHHGETYIQKVSPLDRSDPLYAANLGKFLIELGADRGPIGVYPINVWRDAILPNKPSMSLAREWWSASVRTITSIWCLVPLMAVVTTAVLAFRTSSEPNLLIGWIGYACAILAVVMMIISAGSTFIGGVTFGNLLPFLSGLRGNYGSSIGVAQGRMGSFLGSVLFSWLTAAAAVAMVSGTLYPIGGMTPEEVGLGWSAAIGRFADSFYFVALAMLGVTEIGAEDPATKALTLLVLVLGVALIAFLLGLLVGAVEDATEESRGEASQPMAAGENSVAQAGLTVPNTVGLGSAEVTGTSGVLETESVVKIPADQTVGAGAEAPDIHPLAGEPSLKGVLVASFAGAAVAVASSLMIDRIFRIRHK